MIARVNLAERACTVEGIARTASLCLSCVRALGDRITSQSRIHPRRSCDACTPNERTTRKGGRS
jgi:hypothetical protein